MNKIKLIFIGLGVALLIVLGIMYPKIWQANTNFSKKDQLIFIPTNAKYDAVLDTLKRYDVLKNTTSFNNYAFFKNYKENIKSGAYLIKKDMSNSAMIDMLQKGLQQPIKVTFNTARTKDDLIKLFSKKLELTPEDFTIAMNDPTLFQKYELSKETSNLLFLPNTYEFYWNSSPKTVITTIGKYYDAFWTLERKKQAQSINLSPKEVGILASIVQSESNKEDEQPIVAGVYINRLRQKMKLQADPTVIYAIGDFTINRVLKSMLSYDSPYNTYKYEGLPPGPITTPNQKAIDAVLYYQQNDYIFFCAKEDFSGYHNFASTNAEHEKNAQKYQEALTIYLRKKKEKEKILKNELNHE